MKILFLDVDGVLNNSNLARRVGGYSMGLSPDQIAMFDHAAINMVRSVCQKTNTMIVLSSSWRILHDFREVGEALDLPIIGATPIGVEKKPGQVFGERGSEIAHWIDNNGPVEKYAIIDDDSDMLPEQLPFFVKTDTKTGMLVDHADKLIKILSDEPS